MPELPEVERFVQVYIADQQGQATALIRNEPGFDVIKAVKDGEIYIIDETIVARPTWRLLTGIHTIGNILYPEHFRDHGARILQKADGVLSAAVAGALAAEQLGHAWIPWFSAGFTLVILIFSEILPKTTGVVHSKGLSAVIVPELAVLDARLIRAQEISRYVEDGVLASFTGVASSSMDRTTGS